MKNKKKHFSSESDVFWCVSIPEHQSFYTLPSYNIWVDDGFLLGGHYEQRGGDMKESIVPEQRTYFYSKKEAKMYCLQKGLPLEYITAICA